MLSIQVEDTTIEVTAEFKEFAPGIHFENGVADLEVGMGLFQEVYDFYGKFMELSDENKVKLQSSDYGYVEETTSELKPLVQYFRDMPAERQVEVLDTSRYLNVAPLTNIMCVIIAEKIMTGQTL